MAPGLVDITPYVPLISEGVTLLTPNARLARHIRSAWDARQMAAGLRVWPSPTIEPVEAWLLGQWEQAVRRGLLEPLVPLAEAQQLELWLQVIGRHEHGTSGFMLLRPAAAAGLASEARNLLAYWRLDPHIARYRQLAGFDEDCAVFLQWLRVFEQRLAAAGHCTAVDCLSQLLTLDGKVSRTPVALVDVDELSPLVSAALDILTSKVEVALAPPSRAACLSHPFRDNRTELAAVATWAAQLHRGSPRSTIGIVLQDMVGQRLSLEYLLRREFDRVGDSYHSLPVNFSTGIPLDRAPLIRDALAALSMGLQQVTVSSVRQVLSSRFLDLPDAQAALVQRFLRQLALDGADTLPMPALHRTAATLQSPDGQGLLIAGKLQTLRAMRELRRRAMPSRWVEHFVAALSVWGWPGARTLDSLEYQQLRVWEKLLADFARYDAVCQPLHFKEALALLRGDCQRQVSQPQTSDYRLQVLGPLEAVGLRFDHLWVCTMQGTSWPAAPRPHPFIPIALQRERSMPHASAERERRFAEGIMRHYLRCSDTLHASFCREIDGVPDVPSVLLRDFRLEEIPAPAAISTAWTQTPPIPLQQLADDVAPPLDEEPSLKREGGSELLADQSQCPFRALARHRLRVEPASAARAPWSAAGRGALLHAAMHAFWLETGDQASLRSMTPETARELIQRSVARALDALPRRQLRGIAGAWCRLEQRRLEQLLQDWLAVEMQRTPFTVVAMEQAFSLQVDRLWLQLRIDRIDELPDGSRVIIDYKTDASGVRDWLGDRPANPQMPLYGIAGEEPPAALAYARLKTRDCRFIGLGRVAAAPGISNDLSPLRKGGIDAADWSALIRHWRLVLQRLAREFVEGAARVDPLSRDTCRHCGLQPLCRIEHQKPETRKETA